jgi:hypothetical protein
MELKVDAFQAGYYGCVTIVNNCSSYSFKWDIAGYKKDRKWFKTFWRCETCDNTHVLTKDR